MESNKNGNDGQYVLLSEEKSVVLRSGVVYRPAGPWTPSIHALLRHLRATGFESLPTVIGAGTNEEGQEMVSYIEGDFIHPGPWSDDAIVEVGRMVRRLHDASASFRPDPHALWKPWFLRKLGGSNLVYSHGDIAPWNMVTKSGLPAALIDWEYAGPIDPLAELARVCWLFPQLHDDDVAMMNGLPSPEARARQVRLLVDAYGLEPGGKAALLDMIVAVVVTETAEEAIEMKVTPDSQGPLWGLAWRARSAAWILRHRRLIEHALKSSG